MKNCLLMLVSISLLLLAGCGSDEPELEGKSLGMSSFDPTITEEEKKDADIKFSSGMLVFDFESSDDVTLSHNGNTYSGNYSLEDSNLFINLNDRGTSLKIDFAEFTESPEEYYSYTGKIEYAELEEGDDKSQLVNIIHSNIGMNETYIFAEE